MEIIASDSFAGLGSGASLTGRTLNNALGGDTTVAWEVLTSSALSGNGSGAVTFGSNNASVIQSSTARMTRVKFSPAGGTSSFQVFGFAGAGSATGAQRVLMTFGASHTALRLGAIEALNGAMVIKASKTITPPAADVFCELDALAWPLVYARVFASDGTTLLHEISWTFTGSGYGNGWGMGGYLSGGTGTFDDPIFWRNSPVTPGVLSSPSATVAGPGAVTGSASVNVSAGTMYALFATGTPDAAAIIAGGTTFAVTASGTQTMPLTGLGAGVTAKVHMVHKQPTGENSNVVRSADVTTPSLLPAPTGSVTVTNPVGQTVTVSGTYSGTVASASATLPPAGTPNGAVLQGPSSVTFGSGTFAVTFNGVPFGTYNPPAVTLSNADASATIYGTAFDLISMGGEPEGPPAAETAPSITAHPANASATAGQAATFVVSATGGGLSYQWQRNPGGNTSWADISGATSATYTTPATTVSGGTANNNDTYRVIATNTVNTATSNPASLAVTFVVAPTIITQPASQTILDGATVTVSVSINDGGGTLTYQWASSPDGTTWTNVGTNSPTYTSAALSTAQSGIRYRVTGANSANNVVSSSAVITVNAAVVAPTISAQPASQSITAGGTATLNVVATTGGGTLAYQWAYSTDGGTSWTNVSTTGAVNPFTTLPLSEGQTGIRYRVTVSNSADSVVSNAAVITVTSAADTTAPTLSAASASASSPTAATGSVSTNEANGLLYWIVNTSTTQTDTQVMAGSSQAVTATGAQSVAAPGLTANTTGYRVHYCHVDAAGNRSAVLTTAAFNTPSVPDTTAPTLSAASATPNSPSTASASVTTNEAGGTLYWLANTASTATGPAVKAGASQVVAAVGAQSVSVSSLPANTAGLRVHFLQRDAAGNDSAVLTSAAFATPAAPTSAGFDLHTAPGLEFGDLVGAMVSLSRQSGVPMIARAYSTTTGALVASSGTLTTDSAGRLPRWEHSSLAASTPYVVTFIRASDGEPCSTLMTAT